MDMGAPFQTTPPSRKGSALRLQLSLLELNPRLRGVGLERSTHLGKIRAPTQILSLPTPADKHIAFRWTICHTKSSSEVQK
jgi:hypothetical protein